MSFGQYLLDNNFEDYSVSSSKALQNYVGSIRQCLSINALMNPNMALGAHMDAVLKNLGLRNESQARFFSASAWDRWMRSLPPHQQTQMRTWAGLGWRVKQIPTLL